MNSMPINMITILVLWLIGAALSGRMVYVFSNEEIPWKRRRNIIIGMLASWILVICALIRFYLTTKNYE